MTILKNKTSITPNKRGRPKRTVGQRQPGKDLSNKLALVRMTRIADGLTAEVHPRNISAFKDAGYKQ